VSATTPPNKITLLVVMILGALRALAEPLLRYHWIVRSRLRGLSHLLGAPTRVVSGALPMEMAMLTPADVGLDHLDVSVQSDVGELPVWWVPGVSEDYVVMLHGRGGDRVGLLDMLQPVNEMGLNSIVMSHRNDIGAPVSPDGLDHLGATEWRDLDAVVEQVESMGGERIILFARSAGAAIVGQFLSRSKRAHLVDRVIFDNPVLDWRAVFLGARPRWIPEWLARLVIFVNAWRIGVRMDQFDLSLEPPLVRPPTLIIHSADDEVCPIDVSYRVQVAAPANWDVLVMPTTGGHAGGRFADQIRYLAVMGEWINGSRDTARLMATAGHHRLLVMLQAARDA
jgi:pimeloyl-ACP methyl ester carboxylesterase